VAHGQGDHLRERDHGEGGDVAEEWEEHQLLVQEGRSEHAEQDAERDDEDQEAESLVDPNGMR
jgi:hypothetical protein